MITRLPSETSPFTPEQCQILGQVYNLILSWVKERQVPVVVQTTLKDNPILPEQEIAPVNPKSRGSNE